MLAIPVRGETRRDVETRLAAGDDVKHATGDDAADYLAHDIGQHFPARHAPSGEATDGDRGIEMRTGNVTHGIRHREHGKTESQGDTDEADAEFGKGRGKHRTSATAKNQPERTEELRNQALGHIRTPSNVVTTADRPRAMGMAGGVCMFGCYGTTVGLLLPVLRRQQ